MKKFKTFYFENFIFDKASLTAKFFYSFDKSEKFCEEIFFDKNFELNKNFDEEVFNTYLFNIFLALGISYYKAFPTEKLSSEKYFLSEEQSIFWKKFYLNGLGEFLFRNKISPKNLANFDFLGQKKFEKKDFNLKNRTIVPICGGKDSFVTIEKVKKIGKEFVMFSFGKDYFTHKEAEKAVGEKRIIVRRKIDTNLFSLNEAGNYNGHVPITGIIAFVLLASGYLYDYKFIAMSNEKSANFGNTFWENLEINHQWSKSLEFEKDLADYQKKYIGENPIYFSLLRGFFEVNIAKKFAENKKYFNIFSSCNTNFKILEDSENLEKRWCNKCPKCLFVFAILRPFLDEREVLQIFGEDLYENKSLEKGFKQLLGIEDLKPFECVGTNEEVILSMKKAFGKYEKMPIILKMFEEEVDKKMTEKNYFELEKKLYKNYCEETKIPLDFK